MAVSLVAKLEPPGLKVVVHPPNTYPFASRRGFSISNGQMSTISTKMVRSHRLQRAGYKCYQDESSSDEKKASRSQKKTVQRTVQYQRPSQYVRDAYDRPLYTATSSDENVRLAQLELRRQCGCYTHHLPYNVVNSSITLCYNATNLLIDIGRHLNISFTSQDHIAFQVSKTISIINILLNV